MCFYPVAAIPSSVLLCSLSLNSVPYCFFLGTYSVTFTPVLSGVVFIHVAIQVTPISSSPFKVILKDPQENGAAEEEEE